MQDSMEDILMHVGFNNTVYCIQGGDKNSSTALVEFLIQPDGSWKRK